MQVSILLKFNSDFHLNKLTIIVEIEGFLECGQSYNEDSLWYII